MSDPLFPCLEIPSLGAEARLRVGDTLLTQSELLSRMNDYRTQLVERGLEPGSRVAVRTDGVVETPIALLANLAFGYVSVPLNPKLGPKERSHIIADAEPELLVIPSGETSGGELEELVLDETSPRAPQPSLSSITDDPALILYTSGTTGPPKGAILTRRNIAFGLDGLIDAWRWTDADRVAHCLPLFHVHGLVLGLFGSMRAGGALHYVPRFSPEAVASAFDDGATMFFGVPTMHHRLVEAAEQQPRIAASMKKPRLLVSGSAALPVREQKRIEAVSGRQAYERYGLTETLINCAVPVSGPPRPGYVGPPLKGIELRLVDDERQPIDAHDDTTIGEVVVRGPNVFHGYLNRPDATAKVRDGEGWFYTGDLATRTADGAIRIVGRRATDLIKTGGYKVGAGEVEGCIREHSSVRDVAVLGVPDDDLGERIIAVVVLREGAEEPEPQVLIDLVASQLTPHKRPREIRFAESLPRNAMGKVQKKRLLT